MQVFQVRQGRTGAILWTGAAAGEVQALDAMAHAAGYRDRAALPEGIRGSGLSVEALNFAGPTLQGPTVTGGRSGRMTAPGAADHAALGRHR